MNPPNAGEQNEPNIGRIRAKNKAAVRIDTRGSAGVTSTKPYDSAAQSLPASEVVKYPETENQSEPSDMNEDTVVQTWGEASIGSLIQTNAEQAKALAQNANSIAVLTRILDSQSTATGTPPAGTPTAQIGLSDSIHAPVKWTSHLKRSDNPLPIRPSPKKKAPVAPLPTNPSQRNHNRRLLIEFYPKVAREDRQTGREIVFKINESLVANGASKEEHIDAVQWSLNGNTVIITSETTNAEAMKDHYGVIATHFSPNTFKAHPDHVYHRVKLDRVPTSVDGERTTIEKVMEELTEKWAGFSMLTQRGKPSWLGHESIISKQSTLCLKSRPLYLETKLNRPPHRRLSDWPPMCHMYK
ncbi:hypothetical protein BS47DRAFT_1383109 [Hydnum rufescens UP504]|uniref:Uncharacterized protein n=1 Tax=Hydnum rufescens UP504 TaxID=1448309 RepID=A0A9P6AUG4_9AGAM|nr:hypothetical protein BS47DRAFT_1383109 [Hydnum rufescens UP504]